MPIAFISERYSAGQGASSNNLVSGSFTPNGDALLVCVIHTSDGITSISGHDGGGSWVQIGTAFTQDGRDLEIWACHTPASPSAGTITIDIPYNWNIAATVLEFTGVDVSGTVAASFGTPVGSNGYDQRWMVLNPAAYADVGNATLLCYLNVGGATSTHVPSQWYTQIGDAGGNGTIGAAWLNQEDVGRVQVNIPAFSGSAQCCVEMKAATPATVTTRYVGNGCSNAAAISPETLGVGARFAQFTIPEAGTLGLCHTVCQYNTTGNDDFIMHLYDASGNLLDSSDVENLTGEAVTWLAFSGFTYALEASTVYYLGVTSDDSFSSRAGRTNAAAYYEGYEATSGFTGIVSPADPATITAEAEDYLIYAEYAPAAGGASFPYHSIKKQRSTMRVLLTQ